MTGTVNPNRIEHDAVTQYKEDNSAIPAGAIENYEHGLSQTSQATVANPTYATKLTDTDLTPGADGKQFIPLDISTLAFGQWYHRMRAKLKASFGGGYGDWSTETPFEKASLTPKAPTGQAFIRG